MKNNLLSLDKYRNNPEFYFCKGLRCANKKNLNDAFKNLQKAIYLEPDNCEYKFNIACFLSEMQRPKEANRIFNDILINLNPTNYDCYFGLGCNSFEIGDAEKAAEYFEKYIYFDGDGEFCDEVSEMIFYLKLYDAIAHNDRFIKRSSNSLRTAKKYLQEDKLKNATRELCRAISSNPSNVRARNILTLTLMEQQNFDRAQYINWTVKIIDKDNVWANCLCLYILSHAGKHSRVKKILETLTLGEIENRDDLLCVATTLIVFNKTEELILLLEMYIIQYSDSLIYSILLLGYTLTHNVGKLNEIYKILFSLGETNNKLIEWIEYIKSYSPNEKLLAIDEYNKIFIINEEANNSMYNPIIYQELFAQLHRPPKKISKKYMPIIDCAVQHREIMYTRYYKKEIIYILSEYISVNKATFKLTDNSIEAYSAALEYRYCKQYFIEIGKDELIQKYNLSAKVFDKAVKKLNF